MSNPNNHAHAIGRLVRDPKVFTNSDGSKTLKFNLLAEQNWGERKVDSLPMTAFVRKDTEGLGVFAYVHEGDLVAVDYSIRSSRWEKNGETQYGTDLLIENISFLEPKSVTSKRREEKLAKAAAANAGAAAPADAGSPAWGAADGGEAPAWADAGESAGY